LLEGAVEDAVAADGDGALGLIVAFVGFGDGVVGVGNGDDGAVAEEGAVIPVEGGGGGCTGG
jgi:hypothetical protein